MDLKATPTNPLFWKVRERLEALEEACRRSVEFEAVLAAVLKEGCVVGVVVAGVFVGVVVAGVLFFFGAVVPPI